MANPWIDLSPYSMTLLVGVIDPPRPPLPSRLMTLVGDTAAHEPSLRQLGFIQAPGSGRWVHVGSPPSIEAIQAVFPVATIIDDADMRLFARRLNPDAPAPVEAQAPAAAAARPAVPTPAGAPLQAQTAVAAPVRSVGSIQEVEGVEEIRLTLPILMQHARNLGLNRLGQRVYDSPYGRFLYNEESRAAPIIEGKNTSLAHGLFLRAPDDVQMGVAAEGFIEEIANGGVQRFADLKRFASAVYGEDLVDSDDRLLRVHSAIEAAATRWLVRRGGRTMNDIWNGAQKIQDGIAYIGDLTRHVQRSVTMMSRPIAVAVQRALGTEAELEGKTIVVTGGGNVFAHISRTANLRVHSRIRADVSDIRSTLQASARPPEAFVEGAPDYAGADVVIANLQPGLLERPRTYDGGFVVSRSDVAEALDSLIARAELGQSVLVFRGTDSPEAQEEMERARKWIGARYAIEGTCDIAGTLHAGRPEAPAMRIMVVARRRPAVLDEAPEAALRLTEANDYANLWTWTSQLVYARAKIADFHAELAQNPADELDGTADPELQTNPFQTAYMAMSSIGQASTMIPTNLQGAAQDALARVARKHEDVDVWVANELGMTRAQLEARFSPEQIDGVALAIDAQDRGRASLNSDQTGIGKGRWIAALMRRAVLQGKNVLFVTEREINFSDIFRDIRHIGADEDFSPMILNGDSEVVDEATGATVLRSHKRDYVMERMASGEWPKEHNLIVATYTQFNKPGIEPKRRRRATPAARDIAPMAAPINAGLLEAPAALVDADDDANEPFDVAAEEQQQQLVLDGVEPRLDGDAPGEDLDAPGAAVPQAVVEDSVVSPKSAWLRHALDENTLVILDECHNIATVGSTTTENFDAALARVGAANIVFSSATWAKSAKNMRLYAPLFPADFDTANITDNLRKGGETMQETLSSMLVKDGVLFRREHDLSKFEFSVVVDDENADQNRLKMDALAPILAEMAYLSGDLEKRINAQNAALEARLKRRFPNNATRVAKQLRSLQTNRMSFGSPLYNLSRLFISSLLIDKSVNEAVKALRSGKKPVILLENTVQALMEDLLNGESQGTTAPDFKDLIRRTLGQMTRVTKTKDGVKTTEELAPFDPAMAAAEQIIARIQAAMPESIREADDPDVETHPDFKAGLVESMLAAADAMIAEGADAGIIADAAGTVRGIIDALPLTAEDAAPAARNLLALLPETPDRSVRGIQRLIDGLGDMPVSVIDEIRNRVEAEGRSLYEAGQVDRPWRVEEITGRSLEYRNGQIGPRTAARKVDIKNRFNSGETDCLIINVSGATGIDLHAGARFIDQRQRVLIVHQSPADINKLLQALGRVGRFDQVIGPQILTLVAGLPIEMRLIAMRNAHLRRLSANITSNRHHSGLIENILDLMNPVGDMVCSRYAEARPDLVRLLGFDAGRNADVEARNISNVGQAMADDDRDNQRSANAFLARLAMLPVARQTATIEELEAEYRATIQELDARGENPLKSRSIDGIVHVRSRFVLQGADIENPSSEFHRAVFAQKVFIERAIEPLRGDEVADAVERGMILSNDQMIASADRLARSKERTLQTYLPMEVGVNEALAAGTFTLLNRMNERMDRLIATLRELQPGSSVNMMVDSVVEQAIITHIHVPPPQKSHLASAYGISFVVPGYAMPHDTSLQSLLNDPNFEIFPGLHGDDVDVILRSFDTAIEGARMEERMMLVGNDWLAMDIANTQKLGSMTSWTDAQGVRHRGILVNKKYKDLDFMPVAVTSPVMAAELMSAKKTNLYGNSDLNITGLVVRRDKGTKDCIIAMPNTKSRKYAGVYNHPPVRALVEALNVAAGANREEDPRLHVPEASLPVVIGHLMDAGVRMFTGSDNRKWVNEYMTAHYADNAPAAEPEGHTLQAVA
jgi:hypothetical protein